MKKLWITLLMLPILLSLNTCARERRVPDYKALLVEAVTEGDTEAGRTLAEQRNALIEQGALSEEPVDFDELQLLSRVIYAEAGDRSYSEAYRMCVGELVLNRVASPEFPNTLEEVAYQSGQFLCVGEPEFEDLRPSRSCTEAALRLLLGERRLAPQVLYRSPWQIGPAYVRFYDRRLGYTYFCESVYPELYECEEEAGGNPAF